MTNGPCLSRSAPSSSPLTLSRNVREAVEGHLDTVRVSGQDLGAPQDGIDVEREGARSSAHAAKASENGATGMLDVTDLVAQHAGKDPVSRRWLLQRESVLRRKLTGQAQIFAGADADHSGELDFEVGSAFV